MSLEDIMPELKSAAKKKSKIMKENDNDNEPITTSSKKDKTTKTTKTTKIVKSSIKLKKKNDNDSDSDNENSDAPLDDVAQKYQKKSQLEHIKDLPDTYIGSTIKEIATIWNLEKKVKVDSTEESTETDVTEESNTDNSNSNSNSTSNLHIVNKEFEYVPGLRSIIEEILVNAFDNMNRVNQKNAVEGKRLKKVSYIKVFLNREKGEIAIEND